MSENKMSSLRIEMMMKSGVHNSVDLPGFAHAVMEYVFRLPDTMRGRVDSISYYSASAPEKGVYDRCARIHVEIHRRHYFFFVFAEARFGALQEWKVMGRSELFEGAIRHPDYKTEMIWLE